MKNSREAEWRLSKSLLIERDAYNYWSNGGSVGLNRTRPEPELCLTNPRPPFPAGGTQWGHGISAVELAPRKVRRRPASLAHLASTGFKATGLSVHRTGVTSFPGTIFLVRADRSLFFVASAARVVLTIRALARMPSHDHKTRDLRSSISALSPNDSIRFTGLDSVAPRSMMST